MTCYLGKLIYRAVSPDAYGMTVQEIATKHQLHPNRVSTWKRQAIDGIRAFPLKR